MSARSSPGATVATSPRSWGSARWTPAEAPRAIELWTKGRGISRAVEASGSPAALASTIPMLAHEGHVIVASWYGTEPVSLPLGGEFHRRRLTLRSSQVSTIPASAAG